MKITDALKDRTALTALLDPADPRYVTGTPEDRKGHATNRTGTASPAR